MRRTFRRRFGWVFAGISALGCTAPSAHGENGHRGHHEHRFDDPEHWAARFDAPERKAWQKPEEVVAVMGLQPEMVIADIGAGTGYFLSYLSKAVGPEGRVLGLDIEPKLVDYMKKRAAKEGLGNVEARKVEGDDPQLAAGSVDRVLIVNTWHHIPKRDVYTEKLKAALKPGGAIYIVDFEKDSPTGPPPEFRIPPEVVRDRLNEAGFKAEVVKESLPRQYIVVAKKP